MDGNVDGIVPGSACAAHGARSRAVALTAAESEREVRVRDMSGRSDSAVCRRSGSRPGARRRRRRRDAQRPTCALHELRVERRLVLIVSGEHLC